MTMEDLKTIRSWEDRSDFDFNNLVDAAVVENKIGLIGYGAIKPFVEGFVALKPDLSQFVKAHTFKLLLNECIKICAIEHIQRLHIFPDTEVYADKLLKLGFKAADRKVLALKIGDF